MTGWRLTSLAMVWPFGTVFLLVQYDSNSGLIYCIGFKNPPWHKWQYVWDGKSNHCKPAVISSTRNHPGSALPTLPPFCYETVAIHVVKDSAKDLSFYIPFLQNFLRNIWEGLPTTDVTLGWQWMTCCRSTWVPFRASPRLQPVWKFRLQKLRNESCCYPVARWWWTPLSATSTQEAPAKISLSVPPSYILLMSTSNSSTSPVYSCGALRLPWRGVCLLS